MKTRLARLSHKKALACVLLASALSVQPGSASPRASLAKEKAHAVIHSAPSPHVRAALPRDPAEEARITKLMAAMTLEEKVGQLIQADIDSITPDDLRRYPLGSILDRGHSSLAGDELASPGEWLALADRFYDASIDPSNGHEPIPVLLGTEAVHGDSTIIGATIFPQDIGLGATRDPALVRQIAAITAVEERTTGFDWALTPMLAVARDLHRGHSYESYSERPGLVRQLARATVIGLQGKPGTRHFLDSVHVIAAAEDVPADEEIYGQYLGDETAHEAPPDIEGAAYPAAITAGVQSIVSSFPRWQGAQTTGDAAWLTGLLRQQLGFDGIRLGDFNVPGESVPGEVPGCAKSGCAAAINAGVDVLMAAHDWKDLYSRTLAQARSGQIPRARLDDAVRRVLRVKLRAHLLEEGRPSSRALAGHFELLGSARHRALARRAVRESLVLLKNENHLLPLSPHESVLVAGDGADNIPKQCGGWTLTWQGTGTSDRDFPDAESIYEGIVDAVIPAGGHVRLSLGGELRQRPDVAIVVFGEDPYAGPRGDLDSLEYKPGDKSDLVLMRRLHAQGIPVVSVFLSGRPLWMSPEINASDAFVVAWLPGSEGEGIADVLFRTPGGRVHFDFHGKLSFSWPSTPAGTGPPLFPFGYGLRYTDDGNLKPLPEEPGERRPPPPEALVLYAAR